MSANGFDVFDGFEVAEVRVGVVRQDVPGDMGRAREWHIGWLDAGCNDMTGVGNSDRRGILVALERLIGCVAWRSLALMVT